MIKKISEYLISPQLTNRETIQVIDQTAAQIALVVDSEQRLLGTVTDGDLRRGLLRGETLESPVENIMNRKFRSLPADCTKNRALRLMREETLRHVPGLDSEGRVVRMFLLEEKIYNLKHDNWVVLMAGGQGERLRPMTDACPKPMLRIGGKPMMEIILEQFSEAGFQKFFFSVNYLKQQIMDYFGNGDHWGIEIQYLVEKQPLGTAGSLELFTHFPKHPIIVANGDVLSRVDYGKLLQFHKENKSSATICIRQHETELPFGIVKTNGSELVSLEEKPVMTHSINAGIYVLNPEIIKLLQKDQVCDMPQLLERGLAQNLSINAFPVHEFWVDVGLPQIYEQVNGEWQ